jgi:hypothetical protein
MVAAPENEVPPLAAQATSRAVSWIAQSIRANPGSADHRTIDMVASGAARMTRMVEQLKDVSHARLTGAIPWTRKSPTSPRCWSRKGSKGLGLGLYIAQQIVEAHDGRIEVTSNAEDGTAFRVLLPRQISTPAVDRSDEPARA